MVGLGVVRDELGVCERLVHYSSLFDRAFVRFGSSLSAAGETRLGRSVSGYYKAYGGSALQIDSWVTFWSSLSARPFGRFGSSLRVSQLWGFGFRPLARLRMQIVSGAGSRWRVSRLSTALSAWTAALMSRVPFFVSAYRASGVVRLWLS